MARSFLGSPYKAFSLDGPGADRLLIDLRRFDCFLFVEQILALFKARSTPEMERLILSLRYGDRQVSFCNRFHYFTLWAQNAERSGWLHNLSPEFQGVSIRRRHLNYISQHSAAYAPMRTASNRQCVSKQEAALVVNQSYIPIDQLGPILPLLNNGDIFGLVTDVDGLDVTHVGFIEKTGPHTVNAIHAAPHGGVMRSVGLATWAARVPDVVGLALYEPIVKP